MASRVLRCKKLAAFLWEKLNFTPDKLLALLTRRQAAAAAALPPTSAPGNAPKPPEAGAETTPPATLPPFIPEHWIVLMCNDQVSTRVASLTPRFSTTT